MLGYRIQETVSVIETLRIAIEIINCAMYFNNREKHAVSDVDGNESTVTDIELSVGGFCYS